MMDLVWVALVGVGSAVALATGRVDALVTSVMEGVENAVSLAISLAGVFCLWVGIEKLAEESGLVTALSRAFGSVIGALFPRLPRGSKPVGTVSASILSNVLGLSSSTPLGLKAMSEMRDLCGEDDDALDSMSRLVIINAAGFCIFPSSIIAVRAALGSEVPAIVAGPTAVAGLAATAGGLFAYWLLGRIWRG